MKKQEIVEVNPVPKCKPGTKNASKHVYIVCGNTDLRKKLIRW